jgi:hypothetical protein
LSSPSWVIDHPPTKPPGVVGQSILAYYWLPYTQPTTKNHIPQSSAVINHRISSSSTIICCCLRWPSVITSPANCRPLPSLANCRPPSSKFYRRQPYIFGGFLLSLTILRRYGPPIGVDNEYKCYFLFQEKKRVVIWNLFLKFFLKLLVEI